MFILYVNTHTQEKNYKKEKLDFGNLLELMLILFFTTLKSGFLYLKEGGRLHGYAPHTRKNYK